MPEAMPSPATTPPSERPSWRAHEAPDYQLEINDLERKFLLSDMDTSYLRDRARDIGRLFRDKPLDLPNALEGVLHHERAERLFQAEAKHLAKRVKKPLAEVTRADAAAAWETFPQRERLEEEETEALAHYDVSTTSYWRGKDIDQNDIRLLRADLEARRLSREPQEGKREQGWADVAHAYEEAIGRMSDPGKRFEAQFTYLLHLWGREAGVDHVVECRHALPREDIAQATDIVCSVGDRQFAVQLKTRARSTYHTDEFSETLQKGVSRASHMGAALLTLDPHDALDAYRLWTADEATLSLREKNRRTRVRNTIVKGLAAVTTADLATLLLKESEAAPDSARRVSTRWLSETFIEANSGIPHLIRLGLLAESDRADLNKVRAAKESLKVFAKELRTIFASPEEWQNPSPEAIERVRALAEPRQEAA